RNTRFSRAWSSDVCSSDLDARVLGRRDEAAVAQTVGTHTGVDARDPQLAELALLGAAVTVSVDPSVVKLLHRVGEGAAPGPVVATGELEDAITTTAGFE